MVIIIGLLAWVGLSALGLMFIRIASISDRRMEEMRAAIDRGIYAVPDDESEEE